MSRRPLDLQLPRRRRWTWWAVAGSVLVHLLLFSIPGAYWFREVRAVRERLLAPLVIELPVVETPYVPPEQPPRPRVQPPPSVPPPPAGALEAREPAAPGRGAVEEPARVAPVDTGAGLPVPGGQRPAVPRLRPQMGEGRLWVQPLPLPPRELAQRLARTHLELVDSAVSAIVQAYLDSVLNAPAPLGGKPPAWTKTILGRTFGIDQNNIYLGGLKIPAAVLALLPLPSLSNIDLRDAQRLNDIRADLQYAAARAQTMEEFRRAIRELRERREQEREFERNQRRSPSDTSRTKPP
jgi:hypothetical protein